MDHEEFRIKTLECEDSFTKLYYENSEKWEYDLFPVSLALLRISMKLFHEMKVPVIELEGLLNDYYKILNKNDEKTGEIKKIDPSHN